MLSLHEMFGATARCSRKWHILDENEIEDGIDELGVLIYGHGKNAYWYGSQLSIEETRKIAPYPERHRHAGVIGRAGRHGMGAGKSHRRNRRSDELDFRRCLEIQTPYLGPVKGYYTGLDALSDRPGLFPEDIDTSDPWQFRNVLVR